jgi:phytoene dehydrogenase-like protein
VKQVLVIGAGMGGLAAALRLRRLGHAVRVLEARESAGGLASGVEFEGFAFDGGPYILLDRPGLDWAFSALGLVTDEQLTLRRLEHVYDVSTADGPTLRFHASLDETAEGFERQWPRAGARYRAFVARMAAHNGRLRPLLYRSPGGPLSLLRGGAWRSAPLLLRSLGGVLRSSRLPQPLRDALGIWTHVAGQPLDRAPSVLGFVPALVHEVGAFYARGGIGTIPRALAAAATAAGAEIDYGVAARRIVVRDGRATGVETEGGRLLEADAVVSDVGGVGTYLDLAPDIPPPALEALRALPLQSPGVTAYVAARGDPRGAYLRFVLHHRGRGAETGGEACEPCHLWIRPASVDPTLEKDGWWPARLLSPMDHTRALREGRAGQEAQLDRILQEPWWRSSVDDVRVLGRRVPATWGAAFRLHRDSMNPVMTAKLMRRGRIAHRSPWIRNLYLAGSSTHPGQWVSFCAISGVLAAERLHEDLA